jgi:hypothetical protein
VHGGGVPSQPKFSYDAVMRNHSGIAKNGLVSSAPTSTLQPGSPAGADHLEFGRHGLASQSLHEFDRHAVGVFHVKAADRRACIGDDGGGDGDVAAGSDGAIGLFDVGDEE